MDFDIAGPIGGKLSLSRLQHQARRAQPETPLQAVAGAAGQQRGARMKILTGAEGLNIVRMDNEIGDAHAMEANAGALRLLGQLAIEPYPVDDHGLDVSRPVLNRTARGCDEPDGLELIENRGPRDREAVECLPRENARAMHRRANHPMLFQQIDTTAGAGEQET